jgi:predicted MFS family arabinose efflux permease
VCFTLHALLAVLIFTAVVRVWHLVAIEACFGIAAAFSRPAFHGLVPQTVPEDEIQPAQALAGFLNNVGEFAGPVLATALVLGLGGGYAFAFDAATFLVSAACLVTLRPRARGESPARAAFFAELREGWQAVRSRTWVWATLMGFSFALLVAHAPWFVLGPIVAREEHGGAGAYGWVAAAIGFGTMAGTIVGSRWRPERPMFLGLALCLLWPAAILVYALAVPLGVVVPVAVAAGAGLAVFEIWWLTALAQRIPAHQLSRVTSYDYLGSLTLMPVGYLLAGPVAGAVGAQAVLVGGAIIAGCTLALALLPRETRTLGRAGAERAPRVPDPPVHAA